MNTDELLAKIGTIIEAKLEAEREHTKHLIETSENRIKAEVREEIQASEERRKYKLQRNE